jgi:hypothetical protein
MRKWVAEREQVEVSVSERNVSGGDGVEVVIRVRAASKGSYFQGGPDEWLSLDEIQGDLVPALEAAMRPKSVAVSDVVHERAPRWWLELVVSAGSGAVAQAALEVAVAKVKAVLEQRQAERGEDWR